MKKIVYMLREDHEGVHGPFLGEPGINFPALLEQFRNEKYAEAEKEKSDYCCILGDDFIKWLVTTGVLTELDHVNESFSCYSITGNHKYTPKHWPLCPKCKSGRGESVYYLDINDEFQKVHHACTECGYTWDQ